MAVCLILVPQILPCWFVLLNKKCTHLLRNFLHIKLGSVNFILLFSIITFFVGTKIFWLSFMSLSLSCVNSFLLCCLHCEIPWSVCSSLTMLKVSGAAPTRGHGCPIWTVYNNTFNELQGKHHSYYLDGWNYLKWSQLVRMFWKAQ